jgi:hypothetical protein
MGRMSSIDVHKEISISEMWNNLRKPERIIIPSKLDGVEVCEGN